MADLRLQNLGKRFATIADEQQLDLSVAGGERSVETGHGEVRRARKDDAHQIECSRSGAERLSRDCFASFLRTISRFSGDR